MPHYNWYDLTAYEKASILDAQTFPTYQGVGSPIDNGQPGNPGESYVDTETDALYFCIGEGGPWISVTGSNQVAPPSVIPGTEFIHARIPSRALVESDVFHPAAADWTIDHQTGTALSFLDGQGESSILYTSEEGTFAVSMVAKFVWDTPFATNADGFIGAAVLFSIRKPNIAEIQLGGPVYMGNSPVPPSLTSQLSVQGPPIHYIPADGDISASAIAGDITVYAPGSFPTDGTLQMQLDLYATNL